MLILCCTESAEGYSCTLRSALGRPLLVARLIVVVDYILWRLHWYAPTMKRTFEPTILANFLPGYSFHYVLSSMALPRETIHFPREIHRLRRSSIPIDTSTTHQHHSALPKSLLPIMILPENTPRPLRIRVRFLPWYQHPTGKHLSESPRCSRSPAIS